MNKSKPRADGRYQSKVYLGDGKYKYVYATTRKELEEKVLEVKLALNKGIDVAALSDTFGEWAEQWLRVKQYEVSYKRYTAYRGNIRMLGPLSHYSISKIRPIDLQNLFFTLYGQGVAVTTITACKSAAKQVFDLAISNRVLDYNAASLAKLPRDPEPKEGRRALTDEELRWITDTPHRAQTAAMIMTFAGLRKGELLALRWDDIDIPHKTITVNKSLHVTGTGTSVKRGGKTVSSTRTVDIPQILADYLGSIEHTSDLVCPSAHNTIMSETAWKRLWDSYLSELNYRYGDFPEGYRLPASRFAPKKIPFVIPRITAHWLRHTYITMLYQAGVDVLTAKEQAGHADISTTLEIYTHLDRTHKRRQIDKLNDYLGQKTGTKTEGSHS